MNRETKCNLAGLAFAAALTALVGCLDICVKDYGYEVVRDQSGAPLVDNDGKVQTIHKGQKWSYNKNMVEQSAETIEFSRLPGDKIGLKVGNYRDAVSQELTKLVQASFEGAATLAAKVGAAIATSGGSVAGDAAYQALKSAIARFVAKGGDAANASVTCKDGSCTISDGSISETCTNCIDAD